MTRQADLPIPDQVALEMWEHSESQSYMARIRRAAESWGSAWCEQAAVVAVVEALRRRGAWLRERGGNGSYYGHMPDGREVRVADHIGYEPHEIDIVIDAPMTRGQVWRYVAGELENF